MSGVIVMTLPLLKDMTGKLVRGSKSMTVPMEPLEYFLAGWFLVAMTRAPFLRRRSSGVRQERLRLAM